MTAPADRLWSSPGWASSLRWAPARPTTGNTSPQASRGIKTISRFATDGTQDPLRRNCRLCAGRSRCPPRNSPNGWADMAAEEAIAESGVGRRADFPGPPVHCGAAGRDRMGAAPRACGRVRRQRQCQLQRSDPHRGKRRVQARITTASCSARSPNNLADKFGTKGSPISLSTACASGANRDPARRRSDPAVGEADAALCIGADGSINPESLIRFSLLSRAVDHDGPARTGGQAVRQEPRRLRDGRGRRRPGAGKPGIRPGPRRENPRCHGRLRRDVGLVPTPHPVEPGRQADRRLHSAMHWPTRALPPTPSTTSIRTAPARPRTTRWKPWV